MAVAMDDETGLSPQEALARKKARLLEEVAEIDRDSAKLTELNQIAAKYNLVVSPAAGNAASQPTPQQPQQKHAFDGSIAGLIHCYLTDPRSPVHELRHATRQNYASLLKRINETHGIAAVCELKEQHIQLMYDGWADGGQKIAMAHAMITMFRSLVVFGAAVLKDERFDRLSFVLHRMKFKAPVARNEQLSAEQAAAIIKKANDIGLPSLALAQCLQFYCPLRQKDVIGEWVPVTEPDTSDVVDGKTKWLRGLRWEEIDENLILRHVTSKEGKPVEVSLRKFPIIMEQIARMGRQKIGAVIISEFSGLPWRGVEFRRHWRKIARLCNIPDEIKNRDSGAGASDEIEDGNKRSRAGEKSPEPRDAIGHTLN